MAVRMNFELGADDAAENNTCNTTEVAHTTVYITIVSSSLSMIGCALIIITYILWRDIRTMARAIVVFLAIADFFTAAGYFFGAIVNYIKGSGKGACPHFGRSLRVATRSNPLVARSTALLFSRRCLRCSPSYSDLKFAPFLLLRMLTIET